MPYPVCRFTGTIESVSFEDEYDHSCLDETPFGVNACPTDIQLHYPAGYSLGVKIESVSYVEGPKDFFSCEQVYKVGSIESIFIKKDKVRKGDVFSLNQKIEGTNNPGDSYFSLGSYILKTNKNINKETYPITKTDKKIYKTNIIKKGKILFFIPFSLNLQIAIDLDTGIVTSDIVKETKKPWWYFLVKF